MVGGISLLEIACPLCGMKKELKIPDSIFTQKQSGFIKIQVPQGAICKDHTFMVLTDQNANIVGYEPIDESILNTKENGLEKKEKKSKNAPDLVDLIKDYGYNCISGLIHAKLFGYNSYIISNKEANHDITVLREKIEIIFPEQYRDSYKIDKIEYDRSIYPIPTLFYSLVADKRKNDFLFNPYQRVLHTPWEMNLDYEQTILNLSLEKQGNGDQFESLAQFIYRFTQDVELAISILDNCKKISEKDLIKKMNEKLLLSSVNKSRIKLIKEFINRRISQDLTAKIK